MAEEVKTQELVSVLAVKVHAVYSNGLGAINALVSLSCKGIALLQNIPSITERQIVQVTREQIVGDVSKEDVLAAYQKGVEDTTSAYEKEEAVIDEKIERVVEEIVEPLSDKILKVADEVTSEDDVPDPQGCH